MMKPGNDVATLLAFCGRTAGQARRRAVLAGLHADADGPRQAPDHGGPAPIGTATMLTDGTILLQLRAEAPGIVGEAQFRYPPDDPQYQVIRAHLPTLRPGTSVPVPPFN